ncbi:MAG: transcriptional regulator Spx [Erysipelotrichaceae bacterium]|nr:transcriptional regulator Spx [Erysipelotrichaceae bacterium]
MLVIYTSPGCASCRKAKAWLKERKVPFTEKNIFSTVLNEKEIRFLLARSENGTDDIISKRAKIIKESNIDIDSMSVNELIRFIQNNPSVLKRPIVIDEKRMMVGYDSEEIDMFAPATLNSIFNTWCDECTECDTCSKVKETS